MTSDQTLSISLLPYLYPGTSDEYWLRRARDGRLGSIHAEPGKVRNRAVDAAEVQRRFGVFTTEQLAAAIKAYEADRRMVRKVVS